MTDLETDPHVIGFWHLSGMVWNAIATFAFWLLYAVVITFPWWIGAAVGVLHSVVSVREDLRMWRLHHETVVSLRRTIRTLDENAAMRAAATREGGR